MTPPHEMFARLRKLLEYQGGFYTVEDILQCIQVGTMQSFAQGDTWVVTQVHEFPRKKVLDIVFVLGERQDLHELEPQLEAFKQEIGADMMTATGRMGWLRSAFKGWEAHSVNFVKV